MQYIELNPPYRLVFGRHGHFLVSGNDMYVGQAIAVYGEYGELEWDFMRQVIDPARDQVEVGANIGSHTVAMAKLAAQGGRRLMAVEPQPVLFQNMCANVALNRLFNVQAENCACAAEPGWLSFPPQDYAAVGNFGGVFHLFHIGFGISQSDIIEDGISKNNALSRNHGTFITPRTG